MGSQCYLPPGKGNILAFTPAKAGTRFSDPGGMQGWVDPGGWLEMVYPLNDHPSWTNRARCWLTSLMRPTTLTTTPSCHPDKLIRFLSKKVMQQPNKTMHSQTSTLRGIFSPLSVMRERILMKLIIITRYPVHMRLVTFSRSRAQRSRSQTTFSVRALFQRKWLMVHC